MQSHKNDSSTDGGWAVITNIGIPFAFKERSAFREASPPLKDSRFPTGFDLSSSVIVFEIGDGVKMANMVEWKL